MDTDGNVRSVKVSKHEVRRYSMYYVHVYNTCAAWSVSLGIHYNEILQNRNPSNSPSRGQVAQPYSLNGDLYNSELHSIV